MPPNESAGKSLRWCFHLVDALYHNGVRHAFISPGSRSTPLTLALTHYDGLRCHSVLDERSASFMALGAGKETGIPALFVCTSGTAVANAFPAVIEARMSQTPLIVLSADRPPNLRALGSSQTIDQLKIFSDYPVFFFDTGEPKDTDSDYRRLEYLGYQAVSLSLSKGGPVHLNLPFRKPLEPSTSQIESCTQYHGSKSDRKGYPINFLSDTPPVSLPSGILKMILECKRPAVVAGPESNRRSPFFSWCRQLSIPVLCETGGIREGLTKHPLLLQKESFLASMAPDLIIRTGHEPLHRPTLEALQSWQGDQITFTDRSDLNDATLSATHRLSGSPDHYDWPSVTPAYDFTGWKKSWDLQVREAEKQQASALENEKILTDGHVYKYLLPVMGQESDIRIVLSNSFPVRDYLLFGPQDAVSRLPVLVNRGAGGIDGVTSTAAGSAIASGMRTVLFTGDLAFLHDLSALNNLVKRDGKLKIVVVNNRGGSIFRMLPFEKHDEIYTRYFETPQQVRISAIADAHNLPYRCVDSPDKLIGMWDELASHNTGLLECQTDARASMRMRHPA